MNYKLDEYEEEILESLENGEWRKVKDSDEMIKRHSEIAITDNSNNKIDILLNAKELELLTKKALEEGLSSQSLVYNLVHNYINTESRNK